MISLGATGQTQSWEAHEHDHQFGGNGSIDIGKSQRLQKDGYAAINNLSAMCLGLAKIIQKVSFSTNFESLSTDHYRAEHVSCIEYTNTWSSK
jgi:hypothetical protein